MESPLQKLNYSFGRFVFKHALCVLTLAHCSPDGHHFTNCIGPLSKNTQKNSTTKYIGCPNKNSETSFFPFACHSFSKTVLPSAHYPQRKTAQGFCFFLLQKSAKMTPSTSGPLSCSKELVWLRSPIAGSRTLWF